MHIRSENEPIRSNHGCIKPGFSTDNYSSVDLKIHLKWHVFGDNVGSVFCYVFGILVNYNFDTSFFLDSHESLPCFRYKLFCIKGIFQVICLNHKIGIVLIYRRINFMKVQLKNKKCFIIISLINYRAPYYFCKSKKILLLT